MGRRIALLALASLLLAACGSGENAVEPEPPAAPAPSNGAGETVEPEPTAASPSTSSAAAQVEGVGLDGEPISLADFRGRPVLVNVWSSW